MTNKNDMPEVIYAWMGLQDNGSWDAEENVCTPPTTKYTRADNPLSEDRQKALKALGNVEVFCNGYHIDQCVGDELNKIRAALQDEKPCVDVEGLKQEIGLLATCEALRINHKDKDGYTDPSLISSYVIDRLQSKGYLSTLPAIAKNATVDEDYLDPQQYLDSFSRILQHIPKPRDVDLDNDIRVVRKRIKATVQDSLTVEDAIAPAVNVIFSLGRDLEVMREALKNIVLSQHTHEARNIAEQALKTIGVKDDETHVCDDKCGGAINLRHCEIAMRRAKDE